MDEADQFYSLISNGRVLSQNHNNTKKDKKKKAQLIATNFCGEVCMCSHSQEWCDCDEQ